MCKYFSNGYSCRWMEKCKFVHDHDLRRAFEAFRERHEAGKYLTVGELKELLDPDNKLEELEFEVKKSLYMRYPRPLTKKEKQYSLKEFEREKLDELLQ